MLEDNRIKTLQAESETTAVGSMGGDVDFIVLSIAKADMHKNIIFIKYVYGKITSSFSSQELQLEGYKDVLRFTRLYKKRHNIFSISKGNVLLAGCLLLKSPEAENPIAIFSYIYSSIIKYNETLILRSY